MSGAAIAGVIVSPRRQIVDARGKIAHMLRSDDPEFERFGEVYFSFVNPGVVKAWHLHLEMTLHYTCPHGRVKLVLYDDREESATRGSVMEIDLGQHDHRLITIPPGIWNGFQGMADAPSIVCNCASHAHDPDEIVRKDPFSPDIPFAWPAVPSGPHG